MDGQAAVAFGLRQGRPTLLHLHQKAPLRVLFPRLPAPAGPTAVLLTTSGGLAGGDRLEVRLEARAGACLAATTQAAEKVYRSTGAETRVQADLNAHEGAVLEWLPQETILFDRARLKRRVRIERGDGGSVLAGDLLVLGRLAHGERVRSGLVHDAWEVRHRGRLCWHDAFRIDGDWTEPAFAAGCLGGASALATLVLAADDAVAHLEFVRALTEGTGGSALWAGTTVVGGVLVVRWLGRDPAAVRADFIAVCDRLRGRLLGFGRSLARLWCV
jgi:urease accessory protein